MRTDFEVKGLPELDIVPLNIIVRTERTDAMLSDGRTISLPDQENRSFKAVPLEEVVPMILHQESSWPSTLSRFPIPRGGILKDAFEMRQPLSSNIKKNIHNIKSIIV